MQSIESDGSPPEQLSPEATAAAIAAAAAAAHAAIVAKARKELALQDSKARALIVIHLGTDQLSFVTTAKTAYDQWHLLKTVYEPAGPA